MKNTVKLILSAVLLISLVFTLAGCGGTSMTNPSETLEPPEDAHISDAALELFEGGHFYLSYTVDGDDGGQYIYASDGEATYAYSNTLGFESTAIIKDGKIYMTDATTKTYAEIDALDAELPVFKGTNPLYIGSSEETTDSGTLSIDKYSFDEDLIISYYFSGDQLVKIGTKLAGDIASLNVVEFSANFDEALLEIPSDYTKIAF